MACREYFLSKCGLYGVELLIQRIEDGRRGFGTWSLDIERMRLSIE